ISDITKESSLYTFKFSLIVDKDINKNIEKLEDILFKYNFAEIKVYETLTSNNLFETIISGSKLI
ncbi:MAG: hypothetical protein UCV58_01855, partial [Clostridium saudiense]|nr:hypothetical protein [Clostridium saudiense]